ncbi:hypothetical protein Dsin_015474 [Dipteronia sinensis]|uniref:Large ribosomal subunit protein uL2 RNA-binding domain-containing protein n=1 Tax=Dipteronia sinensis TaxID=43782 RepID=A0AAE0AC15_9ROSI|nr:hypothetical protein Dsin_015474 [Dipteronia sinensis]
MPLFTSPFHSCCRRHITGEAYQLVVSLRRLFSNLFAFSTGYASYARAIHEADEELVTQGLGHACEFRSGLHQGSLLVGIPQGVAFHRGGGSKRLQRKIDLKRSTPSIGIVERIENDPNHSSRIALVRWIQGVQRQPKRKCNMIQDFAPPCKILEPTATTIRGLFSFSSLPTRMTSSSWSASPFTGSNAKDVFFSALSWACRIKRKAA